MKRTLKKINPNKNKTKKIQDNNIDILCKKYPITYEPFEQKIDDVFAKNKLNVSSISFNLEKEVVKDLKKAVSPSNITPNNDFYSYINERWIKNISLEENQQYIVQVDDFRLVQDKVYRELIEIVKDFITNPKTKNTTLGKCLKNYYEAAITYNTVEQSRVLSKLFADYVELCISSEKNLWVKLANSNKNEIISAGAPFVWSINPDEKNPKKYKCYLEPPEVTLLDINIYYDDKEDTEEDKKYKKKYRKAFLNYLNNLFNLAFGENHGYNVEDVYNTEVELLNAMSCDLIKATDDDGYNLVSKEESLKHFGFDWVEFCKALGFKNIPDSFVTPNINYLLCGTKLYKEKWNSQSWKTYWIYIYIRQQYRYNINGFKNFFDFEGNFLRGQEKLIEHELKAIFPLGYAFNTFLTNQYIYHYKNEESVEYVKKISEDLKVVFMRMIKRNKWMQPKTKEIALEKLQNIKLIVGSPNVLIREDPILDYKPDDLWGNLIKIAIWRNEEALKLVDKDVIDIPVIDWTNVPPKFISSQAYVVNAMYTPTENSIYIPLGYIQKPFVDLDERGLQYNLAFIGFTIAHEMSHALDDFGSKYNKYGVLEDWWTKKDKEEYNKIQKNIVNQYEEFELRDGIKFDAWPSIGEDLADISGFSICQEYLRDFHLKNQDILPIKSLSFKTFYVYFALQSRQKISKKAILAQLKTNPHPLDKYRCNIPLSRSRIFRAIFNVKKGDGMWWNSLNSVWSD
jgi:putative endopeptidase